MMACATIPDDVWEKEGTASTLDVTAKVVFKVTDASMVSHFYYAVLYQKCNIDYT